MYGYHEYVSVGERIQEAQRKLARLKKKNPDISPVVIEGKIAKSWWARAWNKNLESYADYANRIGRGRSYLKNGFVFDLRIEPGKVSAIVAGSRKAPYNITVVINTLSKEKLDRISKLCGQNIAGIEQLVKGEFPKELEELFTEKGDGIFPAPREINFSCDCPDWAVMCKHVASVLYGIGARFDEDPLLFFKLRDIPVEALIKKTIEEKMENMLKNSGNKTRRVMENADINSLFGI